MGDVSKKLMNQFATNLNTMLDQQPKSHHDRAGAKGDAADVDAADAEPANPVAADRASANGAPAAEPSAIKDAGVRKINGPAAAPIELSDVAGSAILKRLLPLFGGLVLLWIVVRRLRRN